MNTSEKLVDKIIEYVIKKEKRKQDERKEKERRFFLEEKKKMGLTEEERIHPSDSKALEIGDYITNVEILEAITRLDDYGKTYTEYHHRVTYIDGSKKDFMVNVMLSGVPIPDNCNQTPKVKIIENY